MRPESSRVKRVTLNIPVHTLRQAMAVTGHGITATVIEALEELKRRSQRSALRQLRGKVDFDLDLEKTRQ